MYLYFYLTLYILSTKKYWPAINFTGYFRNNGFKLPDLCAGQKHLTLKDIKSPRITTEGRLFPLKLCAAVRDYAKKYAPYPRGLIVHLFFNR